MAQAARRYYFGARKVKAHYLSQPQQELYWRWHIVAAYMAAVLVAWVV